MTSVDTLPISQCSTSVFDDADQYQRGLRAVEAKIAVISRGRFRSELTKLTLGRLWMQRGHETLARVAWAGNSPSRAPISFATLMKQAPANDSGFEVSPGEIAFYSAGAIHHVRNADDTHWGSMSLSPEDLAAAGHSIVGRDLTPPSATCIVRPNPELMSRLLQLHASAGRLAKVAPKALSHPEVARALEQKLLHIMIRCLVNGDPIEASRSNRRHTATLVRLEGLLLANHDRALHLPEMCAALGVSERSLRLVCHEHLGMGPVRYLWIRRMNLAHADLGCATSGTTTVTEIATRYGFWGLGRFAVTYRTLFGEPPSATLARAPQNRRMPLTHPFALVRLRPA